MMFLALDAIFPTNPIADGYAHNLPKFGRQLEH